MTSPATGSRFKVKNPNSTVDYEFDWTAYLATSDSLSTATCVIGNPVGSGSDLSIVSVTNSATTVTVFVSAGVLGTIYEVTNTVTTLGGRADSFTALIEIQEK